MRLRLAALAFLLACTSPVIAEDWSTELASNRETRVPTYLSPALQKEVDQLRRDIEVAPTDESNLLQRVRVLWRWANAYALTGRAIHPELPATVARMERVTATGVGGERAINQMTATYVDWAVREFAFQDAHPAGIGKLTTDKLGPYPVDTLVTIAQTYTVGEAPLQVGGGLLVTPRYHAGIEALQWDNPAGESYLAAYSSNPDVELEIVTLPMFGMFSGQLGGFDIPKPYVRIARGEMRQGDKLTVVIGDRSQGGPGFRLPSTSNDAMRFKLWVSLQNPAELFVLPELPFYSVGGATTGVRGFAPSIVKPEEPITLSVRSEDSFRNRATSGYPVYGIFEGERKIGDVTDQDHAVHLVTGVRLKGAGPHYLTIRSADGTIEGAFNPILVEDNPAERIYWGETHGHSGFAEGSGTVDGFFNFAREDARLDFMTLSEHDLWMDDFEWETLRGAVIRENRPGEFITFLGYEWTVLNAAGGHHNVLFRTPEGRRRAPNQEAPTLPQLYPLLKARNRVEDLIVIPHAHNPGQWWVSDSDAERLVEITSNHGTFEWLGRAYLANGFRLGFIGGSDDHIGHPGIRPLNTGGYGSDNFGGLAAVMAGEKSRDAIFDALRDKRTYATNGARIILKSTVNAVTGGRAIAAAPVTAVKGRVIGTGPIDSIALIKNGDVIAKIDYLEPERHDEALLEVRLFSESDPLQRGAQSRGWRVWRGTLKVAGATLKGVRTPAVENIYRESARVSEADPQTIEFYIRTRGASKSILLELADVSASTRFEFRSAAAKGSSFKHVFAYGTVARQGGEIVESRIGKFADSVQARFVSLPSERDRSFDFVDKAASKSGDSYFVRVVQTDGGMAWSSPVWVADQQ